MSKSGRQAICFAAGADRNTLPGLVPALLLNLPGNASDESEIEKSHQIIKLSGASITCLDSGGFQLYRADEDNLKENDFELSKKHKIVIGSNPFKPIHYKNSNGHKVINLTPEHLVYAAEKLKPDIVMALDYPIISSIEDEEKKAEFYRKLTLNVKWAKETAILRQKRCPEIKLYLPIQAFDIEQLVEYLSLIKGVQFDGFSLPMRNMTVKDLINFMIICSKQGAKAFHLLGVAKYETIVISAYCGYHLFDTMSWDATTWRMSAERFQYFDYRNLAKFSIQEDIDIVEKLMATCPCPWCQTNNQSISTLYKDEVMSFLRCHNYWVTNKVSLEIHSRSNSLDELVESIKSNNSHTPKKFNQLLASLKYADLKINSKKSS